MKRKITAAAAVLVLICTVLSSCSPGETELRNRLIIEGMGVDKLGGEYILTVQTLNTAQEQSTDNPASDEAVSVYTVKGKSVCEALGRLRLVSGKNPLYSQNRIIIIGSSAENEISESLDFFVREYASRINVLVAVSENSASDILCAQSDAGTIGAKNIQEIIEQAKLYSYAAESEIYYLMNAFSDKNAGVCVPLLTTEKGVKGKNDETVTLSGTRVFKNCEAKCTLSPEETVMYLLASGKSEKCEISFEDSDGVNTAVEILKSKTTVKTGKKELPDARAEVKIKCGAGVLEYDSGSPDGLDRLKLDEITEITEKMIEDGMRALFEKMFKEEKTDIFGFNSRFSFSQRKKYYEFEDGWESVISKIEPKITVDVELKRIGINSARFG